jgi:phospholipid transport system substrate-binding protein
MAVAAFKGRVTSPGAVVKSAMARVTTVLKNARVRPHDEGAPAGPDVKTVHGEIRRIASEVFDVEQMARGILSRQWAARSAAQQSEFVRLFTSFLERSCVANIKERWRVTILQVGEVMDGNFAVVTWRIFTLRTLALLVYRLHLKNGRWRIYDVLLNGESLVAAGRSRFDRAINSPTDAASVQAALVEVMDRWTEAAGVELSSTSA